MRQLHAIALLGASAAQAPYAKTAIARILNAFLVYVFIFVLLLKLLPETIGL